MIKKTTKEKEKKTTAKKPAKRIKKIKDISTVKEELHEKKRIRKPSPVYALDITETLYLSHDTYSWKIMKKNTAKNKQGEYFPDKALLYYATLDQAIKGIVQYQLLVPDELKEIKQRLQDIYNLIDKRIPPNIKPRSLFHLKKETQDD